MSKSEKFIENFKKTFEMMGEKLPDWMRVWIVVYARDATDWTEETPEWESTMIAAWNLHRYDRQVLRDYVNDPDFLFWDD